MRLLDAGIHQKLKQISFLLPYCESRLSMPFSMNTVRAQAQHYIHSDKKSQNLFQFRRSAFQKITDIPSGALDIIFSLML